MRCLLAIVLTLLLAAGAPAQAPSPAPSAPAQPSPEAEAGLVARLAAIRTDLLRAEREQAERAGAVNRSLADLAGVERQIAERNRTLRALTDQAAVLETRLTELYAERARQETELSGQKASLAALLRSAYALGRLDTLKLVLAQDQLADTGRLLAYQSQLQRVRGERIGHVRDLLATLNQLQTDTGNAQVALAGVQRSESENLAALKLDRERKAVILRQLKQALAQVQARVQNLSEDQGEIEELLARLRDVIGDVPALLPEDRPFVENKGHLPRPVAGRVTLGFGETGARGRASAGVHIAAARGAEIHAVSRGRVAFADWLRGYGLLLIIDHGDGYMSLYGRCETLLKREGDWIEANAAIATVGDSGGAGDTGLYFELRHRGEAMDPAGWWQ